MTGKQLKAIQAALGWTQGKLAGEVGVSRTTIGRYMINPKKDFHVSIPEPMAKLIRMIAQSNGVNPDNPKLPAAQSRKKRGK